MDIAKPKVSIVTASYNYENYIKETIESVINQTCPDWEMIVVDDGSKDNSVQVISSYCEKDSRIKLYTHENGVNKGLAETVKLGISKAQADWIIFLESDDTITPNYIEKKLEIVEKYPSVKFIYNDINLFGDEERIKEVDAYKQFVKRKREKLTFPCKIVKEFERVNMVPTFSCVMLNKCVITDDIDWNAKMPSSLDWYLWVQIARNWDFYYIDEELTNWRMSKKSYINHKYSDFNVVYFKKIQIPEVIYGRKSLKRMMVFLKELLNAYKKRILRLRFSGETRYLILFGKTIYKK